MRDIGAWPFFAVVWALVCGGAIAADPAQTWRLVAGACLGMNVTMTVVAMRRAAEREERGKEKGEDRGSY